MVSVVLSCRVIVLPQLLSAREWYNWMRRATYRANDNDPPCGRPVSEAHRPKVPPMMRACPFSLVMRALTARISFLLRPGNLMRACRTTAGGGRQKALSPSMKAARVQVVWWGSLHVANIWLTAQAIRSAPSMPPPCQGETSALMGGHILKKAVCRTFSGGQQTVRWGGGRLC